MLPRVASFPFYCFLLPLFFVFHVVNNYFGLIEVGYVFRYIFIYFFLSAVLLLLGYWFFRSTIKAGIWACILLIIFLFFGYIHDFIKSFAPVSFFTSYSFILPLIAVLFIVLTIYVKKSHHNFQRLHRYFTFLALLLTALEIALLTPKLISPHSAGNNYAHKDEPVAMHIANCSHCVKPDIFFIVFDEYPSSKSLQQYFGFDNTALDTSLQKNGFYVATESKSNYNITPLSLASTLNMQYFQQRLPANVTQTLPWLQAWHTLKMSRLPDSLSGNGYRVLNYGFCDFNVAQTKMPEFFTGHEKKTLYLETLYGRFMRDIWWNFGSLPVMVSSKKEESNRSKQAWFNRHKTTFNDLIHELNTQAEQPKFVFGHFMMPHEPFLLNRNGQIINDPYTANIPLTRERYLEQLRYTNVWIDSLSKAANTRGFSRPRIVIIEGDHGYRGEHFDQPGQYDNLNAYYFSDKDYSLLYDSISPVNSFRVILNKYFNAGLPLLKDSIVQVGAKTAH